MSGFRRQAFFPCYGLAEATLIVTGGERSSGPIPISVQKDALKRRQALQAGDRGEVQHLISSGRPLGGQKVLVVDQETGTRCSPDEIGEIWVSGESVAQGYWNQAGETEKIFGACLADTGEGPFLRTGDLGFFTNGELVVTGRIKDLIIIRGQNHYPSDIEFTVEKCHPALRPGCGAAFSVDVNCEERLVVVQEVSPAKLGQGQSLEDLVRIVRGAVAEAHEIHIYAVVLILPHSIPKTSSGKIQRHACREEYLAGSLEILQASQLDEPEQLPSEEPLTREAILQTEPELRPARIEAYLASRVARLLRISVRR